MTGRYAANTRVDVTSSRNEIEKLLERFGATDFGYSWETDPAQHVIGFRYKERVVRYILPMPDPNDKKFTHRGFAPKTEAQARSSYEQAVKERWRALVLLVKAKLAGVEAGIVSFEDEFLAETVIPSGATVSQWLQPQLKLAIEGGHMPPLLPGPKE